MTAIITVYAVAGAGLLGGTVAYAVWLLGQPRRGTSDAIDQSQRWADLCERSHADFKRACAENQKLRLALGEALTKLDEYHRSLQRGDLR